MKFNSKLLIAFVFVIFYSCSNEDENNGVDGTFNEVQFTSEIDNPTGNTRAYNSFWEPRDQIGVFMKTAGAALSNQSIVNGGSNRTYTTTGNGAFVATTEGQAIYLPVDNSKVDFIAYYPFQPSISNFVYKVDVTDQSIPQNIDLLYSNNLTGINTGSPSKMLQFSHQLSKINFNITVSNNVSDISNLSVSVAGMKTLADFNLADGSFSVNATSEATVTFKTTVNANTASAQAILLPDNGGANRVVTFNLPSVGTFSWTIPNDTKLQKGYKYTYDITLDASGIIVTPVSGWVETPAMGALGNDLMYVTHMMSDNKIRNFSMLYDKKYKLAYWVAYPLHSYYIGGSGRTDAWKFDPKIDDIFQPNLSSSYKETNLDRGHQIPSGDRTRDKATNAATFYFSNMTAQEGPRFNQSIWASLEGQVRTWMARCDTLYVVTGAMITTRTNSTIVYAHDKDGQLIAKPKYYYKALAQRVGDTYYTLAIKMDNIPYASGDNYNNYRLTVKELEEETGYTFFPSIPANTKATINTSRWN